MTGTARRVLVPAAQGAATVLLLWLLFRSFDWSAFRILFARLPLWFYAASLLVVIGGHVMYAWRWKLVLEATGPRVPFGIVLQQYLVGAFMNNFFPSTIGGDGSRVFYLGRVHGYRAVTASVFLDRVLGFGILALLATAGLWGGAVTHPRYLGARVALTAASALFLVVIALMLVGTGGLPGRLQRFGARAVALASRLQAFRTDLAKAVRAPGVWLYSVASVVGYMAMLAVVYEAFIVINGGHGPGTWALLTVLSSLSILSTVPIAINGLGLREQLHVLLLAPLGVGREVAVAISLLLFGHTLITSVIGGVLWWRAAHPRGPT